jgi:hypothetical protein
MSLFAVTESWGAVGREQSVKVRALGAVTRKERSVEVSAQGMKVSSRKGAARKQIELNRKKAQTTDVGAQRSKHFDPIEAAPRGRTESIVMDSIDLIHVDAGKEFKNDRLYTYNPSVVKIPIAWQRDLGATYLAALRVSNHNNCWQVMQRVPATHVEYLGLVLLDANFKQIIGRELVVKTPEADCRMHSHANELLLWCATSFMNVRVFLAEDGHARFNCDPPLQCPASAHKVTNPDVIVQSGLQFEILNVCKFPDALGKNLNVFELHGRQYIETWPLNVDAIARQQSSLLELRTDEGIRKLESNHNVTTLDTLTCTAGGESFTTYEAAHDLPQPRPYDLLAIPSGGGCCVHLARENSDDQGLLVGIGHYHLRNYQYLAFMYAFEAQEPFKVVGTSRPFCWPNHAESPDALLDLDGVQYPCPYIEMSMSIVEKVDDPDHVVISYGANDCASYLVEISKQSIRDKLSWF